VTDRRFPPPWSVEDLDACFVVKDSGGQKVAYVYFEDEPGRRSAAKMMTKDEARRIAVNIAGSDGPALPAAWTVEELERLLSCARPQRAVSSA
jgi:hypothetical protein